MGDNKCILKISFLKNDKVNESILTIENQLIRDDKNYIYELFKSYDIITIQYEILDESLDVYDLLNEFNIINQCLCGDLFIETIQKRKD